MADKRPRVFDRDALLTWPDLTVSLRLFPWQWRLLPRGWYDYSPRGGDRAGWWGIDGEWLFLKVSFGFNLPPFTTPWPKQGCDCTELCEMGPTCPGGYLAGLPGAGCYRTREAPRGPQLDSFPVPPPETSTSGGDFDD